MCVHLFVNLRILSSMLTTDANYCMDLQSGVKWRQMGIPVLLCLFQMEWLERMTLVVGGRWIYRFCFHLTSALGNGLTIMLIGLSWLGLLGQDFTVSAFKLQFDQRQQPRKSHTLYGCWWSMGINSSSFMWWNKCKHFLTDCIITLLVDSETTILKNKPLQISRIAGIFTLSLRQNKGHKNAC